jgi:hypothetical protein
MRDVEGLLFRADGRHDDDQIVLGHSAGHSMLSGRSCQAPRARVVVFAVDL